MAAAFMPSLTYSSFAATAKKATKVTKASHADKTSFTRTVGTAWTLKYKLSPSKLTSSAKKVAWKSSNSKVAKITTIKSGKAVVSFKSVGKASVTVYTKANKKARTTWNFKVVEKKGTTKNTKAPVISGTENVKTQYGLKTDYNDASTVVTNDDLLKGVTAKDYKGNTIPVTVSIKEDGSTTGIQRITPQIASKGGVFDVTYTATDSEGNTATKTIKVTVKNQTPEVVANNFSVSIYSKDWNDVARTNDYTKMADYLINRGIASIDDFESFKSTDKATDKTVANFEKIPGNTVEVTKVTDSTGKALEIVDKNNSKNNKVDFSQIKTDRPGTYNVTYKVTDFLGASVEKTVTTMVP
jgi:hypothetical protein